MDRHQRLSICYAAPGHDLLPSAGPTRNVLNLVESLSQWADVTVAFRRVLEPIEPRAFKVVEIQHGPGKPVDAADDAAVRGMGFVEFLSYMSSLRGFVHEELQSCDIVLEKSWLLSGYLASVCGRKGIPAVVVENIVRVWNEPLRKPQDLIRYARYRVTQRLVGRYLCQAPLIIVETQELKDALVRRWRIPTDAIEVVGLGVDHGLFRPLDAAAVRSDLGISPAAKVLLYAGALDKTHDLAPVLEAMRRVSGPLQLHIVGDGMLKGPYEKMRHNGRGNVFFHGRVSHTAIPQYIAAADLCLAPYDPTAFPNGQIAYSTLKIPEYMACARPVVSVPSGHITTLIQHGISGFLFHNNVEDWTHFLSNCPSRGELKKMGTAAAGRVVSYSWKSTALSYLASCEKLIQKNRQEQIPPIRCAPS